MPPDADAPQDRAHSVVGPLVIARQIELHEPRGHIFGPWDLEIQAGGVTLIQAPMSVQRTALLLALCGRMHLTGGSITVMGYENRPHQVFKHSAVACLDEAEEIKPAVTVRDVVTEQRRWNSSFFTWVPKAEQADLEAMCSETFGDIALPGLDEFVEALPAVQQILLRIAVANSRRPALLVVGRLDQFSSDTDQSVVLQRLIHLGRNQSVIVGDVNPPPPGSDVRVIDLAALDAPRADAVAASTGPTAATDDSTEASS